MRFGERSRSGTSVSVWTQRPTAGVGYGTATGGSSSSITVGGQNYTLLTFTSDSNLVVSKAGLFDVLMVGGGGGGNLNAGVARAWGGGAGGQVIGWTSLVTVYLNASTIAIDVGAGGAQSTSGSPSSIGSFVTACGGGRESGVDPTNFLVSPYGSGGGGSNGQNGITTAGTINANNGGNCAGFFAAGGGGGAASAGGNGVGSTGGAGGNGLDISGFVSGATYYAGAGGGGGAASVGGAAGNGGVAGKTSGTANNGVNYGAGGGGSYGSSLTGGAGAAGVVYVRFKV